MPTERRNATAGLVQPPLDLCNGKAGREICVHLCAASVSNIICVFKCLCVCKTRAMKTDRSYRGMQLVDRFRVVKSW